MFLMAANCVLEAPVCFAIALQKDQIDHPACAYCGMDRQFARSRTVIIYNDGTIVGSCSLQCAAIDLYLKIEKIPLSLLVADYNTRRLIDAETAHWVIGDGKTGVMTRRAKWAFASGKDAGAFMAAHGGSAGAFPGVLRVAFHDLCEDPGMARAGDCGRNPKKTRSGTAKRPAGPLP